MRFQTSKLFFTYSQCDVSPWDLHEHLSNKFECHGTPISKYCIVRETHKDGGYHLHAIIITSAEVGSFTTRYFDLLGKHPNIGYLSSAPHAFKYLNKEHNPIHNYTEEEVIDLLLAAEEKSLPKKRGPKPNKIDWNATCKNLMEGANLMDMVIANPSLYIHLKKLQECASIWRKMNRSKPERLTELKNKWYWGPTGAGKSTLVYDKHSPYYMKSKDPWWNGYEGEETVYYEDVDGSWFDLLNNIKNEADYGLFAARVKCESPMMIRPKMMIVTANYSIRECYKQFFEKIKMPWDEALVRAVERRFEEVYIEKYEKVPDVYPTDYFFDPEDITWLTCHQPEVSEELIDYNK